MSHLIEIILLSCLMKIKLLSDSRVQFINLKVYHLYISYKHVILNFQNAQNYT